MIEFDTWTGGAGISGFGILDWNWQLYFRLRNVAQDIRYPRISFVLPRETDSIVQRRRAIHSWRSNRSNRIGSIWYK